MAAESKPLQPNTPPTPPTPSQVAGPNSKTTNTTPTPSPSPSPIKQGPKSFLDLLPLPRKPYTSKQNSPSRLRFVMSADTPVDVFSKPEEAKKKLVIERKPAGAVVDTDSPSPTQYQGTYIVPYFTRPRRFQGPRKQGVYEKIHEEWIKKALLRQEKDLQWDPKTGEPLFEVEGGEGYHEMKWEGGGGTPPPDL
ncbi:hypothetical protein TWF718_005022 [Orbilia javanica]|uniref:Uncharacterized protein n=1 Tax=Orbilia javanica TaxID=47235 RepID=A0AAN8N3M2_9PEZI